MKVLCWGRMTMESHRWFSVALKRACSDISWSYDVSAWCDVTGIIRSTMPSSCSTANHLSHRNVYLHLRINTNQNSHYSQFRYIQFITSSIRERIKVLKLPRSTIKVLGKKDANSHTLSRSASHQAGLYEGTKNVHFPFLNYHATPGSTSIHPIVP